MPIATCGCGRARLRYAEASELRGKRCPKCGGAFDFPVPASVTQPPPPTEVPRVELPDPLLQIRDDVHSIQRLLFVVLVYVPIAAFVIWLLLLVFYFDFVAK